MSLTNPTHPIYELLTHAAKGGGHTTCTPQMVSDLRRAHGLIWTAGDLTPMYDRGDLVRLEGDVPVVGDPRTLAGEARIARWLARGRARNTRPALPLPIGGPAHLSPSQGLAWARLAAAGGGLLTGGPGTGKTYLTAQIIHALNQQGAYVSCAAPTGKAASVLTMKLDHELRVTTIHSMLGLIPGQRPSYNQRMRLEADVVVIDEASMIDAELMGYIFDALRDDAHLLLVGDPHQLPPIGPGAPFRDLIEDRTSTFAHAHLSEVMRQQEGNGIIQLATSISAGRVVMPDKNVHHFRLPAGQLESEVVDLYCDPARLARRFNLDNVARESVILSSVKQEKFDASTININTTISHRLHPERTFGSSKFTRGDRVMFTVNNPAYGFVNGELGVLEDYHHRHAVITNDHGTTYELDDYSLGQYAEWAYALTVHKAQGSECKVVALILHPRAKFMFTRNLVYTAVTRASQDLILLGDLGLLADAVGRVERRSTALSRLVPLPELCERIISKTVVASLAEQYGGDYL